MIYSKMARALAGIGLALIMLLIPWLATSCSGPAATNVITTSLENTLVPDINLDLYIYVNQGSPTSIPHDLLQTQQDIPVSYTEIWGVVDNDTYSIAGAVIFVNDSDAGYIYSQLSSQNDVWTKLADKTIYFVQGSGVPADSLKNAISNSNFKRFDDKTAMAEISRMPYSDSLRPIAVGYLKPSQPVVNLIKQHVYANTASTLDSVYTWGKPRTIALGFYASQKLEITDILHKINTNTIWNMNLGAMALIDSSIPGILFNPIASHLLDSNGLTKISTNGLIEYQTSSNAPDGKTVPILINVDGNRVFLTAATQQTFAQALLTGIQR